MKFDVSKFRTITYPGVPENRYLVSEDGKVFSNYYNRLIKPFIDNMGYYRIGLGGKNYRVARLVAWQWFGNRDIELTVDHKDGNKLNNHYSNLEWVTIKENVRRARELGLLKIKGEDNGNNKYPETMIHEICKMFENGKSNIEVFRHYIGNDKTYIDDPTFYHTLHKIRQKKNWPDITSQYHYEISGDRSSRLTKPTELNRFNINEIYKVCELISKGKSVEEILKELNVNTDDRRMRRLYRESIGKIRRKEIWIDISDKYIFPIIQVKNTTGLNEDELFTMMSDGYTFSEILKFYGISKKADNVKMYTEISQIFNNFKLAEKNDPGINMLITISEDRWEATQ